MKVNDPAEQTLVQHYCVPLTAGGQGKSWTAGKRRIGKKLLPTPTKPGNVGLTIGEGVRFHVHGAKAIANQRSGRGSFAARFRQGPVLHTWKRDLSVGPADYEAATATADD